MNTKNNFIIPVKHEARIQYKNGSHQAYCRCGWKSGNRVYVYQAREALQEHFRKKGTLEE
jgi:hypothetical protein